MVLLFSWNNLCLISRGNSHLLCRALILFPFYIFYQWFNCPLIKRQCRREYFSFSRASWLILWSHMWSLWTEVHTKSNLQRTRNWRAKNRTCKTQSWRQNPHNALWVSADIHNLIKHALRTSARACILYQQEGKEFCLLHPGNNSLR